MLLFELREIARPYLFSATSVFSSRFLKSAPSELLLHPPRRRISAPALAGVALEPPGRGVLPVRAFRRRKGVAEDDLKDESIRTRGKPAPNAEIHVDVASLEIGYGEQSMLLVLQRDGFADLAVVAVIFETEREILVELVREPDGRRKFVEP